MMILCILSLFISCSKEQFCSSDVVAYLKTGFYTWENGQLVEKSILKFTAYGISFDSLLYDNKSNAKFAELPLSNLSDTSRFVFKYRFQKTIIDTTWILTDTLSAQDTLYISDTTNIPIPVIDTITAVRDLFDTLDIIYLRRMYLVSPLCGFGYNYEILEAYATHHYIDSVFIVNRYVTIVDKENEDNLKILF